VPPRSPYGPGQAGRPQTHASRAILDAVFYILRSGCTWRLLPRDFALWKTFYGWFRNEKLACVSPR